jgi:hypothetical protein
LAVLCLPTSTGPFGFCASSTIAVTLALNCMSLNDSPSLNADTPWLWGEPQLAEMASSFRGLPKFSAWSCSFLHRSPHGLRPHSVPGPALDAGDREVDKNLFLALPELRNALGGGRHLNKGH